MKILKKWGISTQINFLIFIMFLLLVIWFASDQLNTINQIMSAQIQRKGITIARNLAAHVSTMRSDEARDTLSSETKNIISTYDDVRYIIAFNGKGDNLVTLFPEGEPNGFKQIQGDTVISNEAEKILKTKEGNIKDFLVPLNSGKKGYVRIGIGENNITLAMADALKNIVLKSFLVMVVGMICVYLTTRLCIRPISNLVQATEDISRGNYTTKVDVGRSTKEIDHLANAFNTMVQNLAMSQRENKKLEQKREELLDKLVSVLDEERKRISRDLHDEVGQVLTALAYELPLIDEAPAKQDVLKITGNMRNIINDTLQVLKEMIWNLRPIDLDDLRFEEAVEKHIIGHLKRLGINADLTLYNMSNFNLSPSVTRTLFLIIQEAARNAVKHARPDNISVVLECTNDSLIVIIENDGQGFEVEEVMALALDQNKFGLFGMKERAAYFDGSLTIESTKVEGTTVYLKMPLKRVVA